MSVSKMERISPSRMVELPLERQFARYGSVGRGVFYVAKLAGIIQVCQRRAPVDDDAFQRRGVHHAVFSDVIDALALAALGEIDAGKIGLAAREHHVLFRLRGLYEKNFANGQLVRVEGAGVFQLGFGRLLFGLRERQFRVHCLQRAVEMFLFFPICRMRVCRHGATS